MTGSAALRWFTSWHWSSYLVLALVFYLLWQRLPLLWQMYQDTGHTAPRIQVTDLGGQAMLIPTPGRKQALIFWATWCAPCRIELARINAEIQAGKIDPAAIIAISLDDNVQTVADFIKKENYRFTVVLDPDGSAARAYGVELTPSLIFVDEAGTIHWQTLGLSPSLEWRLERFFQA